MATHPYSTAKHKDDRQVQTDPTMLERSADLLLRLAVAASNHLEQRRHALVSRPPVLSHPFEVAGPRAAVCVGVADGEVFRKFCVVTEVPLLRGMARVQRMRGSFLRPFAVGVVHPVVQTSTRSERGRRRVSAWAVQRSNLMDR